MQAIGIPVLLGRLDGLLILIGVHLLILIVTFLELFFNWFVLRIIHLQKESADLQIHLSNRPTKETYCNHHSAPKIDGNREYAEKWAVQKPWIDLFRNR